jgi:transcriptional regulator with XRE-family HTH domain
MSVGKQIRKAREAAGLTQRQLAEILGVTSSAVANYENDISHPKESVFIELYSALGVDANYLYNDMLKNRVGFSPDSEELMLLNKYRRLDEHGKRLVKTVFDLEYARVNSGEDTN